MEYKQRKIAEEIRRRIAEGVYTERLPTLLALSEDFQVNFKTAAKAVRRLTAEGLLTASPKTGIRIADPGGEPTDRGTIDVIFEGFAAPFSHPFWREIWSSLLEKLCVAGYSPSMTMLEADSSTGILKLDRYHPRKAEGRVVLGTAEKSLFRILEEDGTPFLSAGDPVDDMKVPQIVFDFEQGIRDAVQYLVNRKCSRIAFIGQTRTFSDSGVLRKYRCYLNAVQEHFQIDPLLIEHTRPLSGAGATAIEALMKRTNPDSVIVAYDTLMPEVSDRLRKMKKSIPAIGCDGLNLPGLPFHRPVAVLPLRKCGELAARNLIAAIESRHRIRSEKLEAVFRSDSEV